MSSLVVRRQRVSWQDMIREYSVLADGREVARIKNGMVVEVPLSPGRHLIQVRIDWCRSPELEVNVTAGQPTVVECGPNANPFTVLLYVSLLRNRYLWLRYAQPGS